VPPIDERAGDVGRFERGPNARSRSRRVAGVGLAAAAVIVVAGLVSGTRTPAAAAGQSSSRVVVNLSDPTAGHSYRHGALPLRVVMTNGAMATTTPGHRAPPGGHRAAGASQRNQLSFGGGSVVTGSPKVYLVFFGSQWGTHSVNGGYDVYSGDPHGLAPNLQAFFKGLGTNNEQWSTLVTQYCQGVATGAKACPVFPSASHVPYPSSSVLGGVWEDTSTTPTAATANQIAQEAANTAVHFGNPPNAQYVVVSPTGTDPDGWLDPTTGYCAYHDSTGDPGLGGVSGPDVPYTNMPYVPDVGAQCSTFANPGILDGADETASHEYAETLTDPFPSSGWVDRRGSEIGDKCENLTGGAPGASQYVALSTGTFVLQGMWANDFGKKGGCQSTHSNISATNPGRQKSARGVPVSLQVNASDVRGLALSYTASGLPAGLVINPASGLVSGTPQAHGRFATSVGVSDASGTVTLSFVWTIKR
jgi:hypothetical protein